MKVLLLGATGLLGHNVLRRLLADGHRVVALVRNRWALMVEGEGCEVRECRNIVDAEVLGTVAAGCEAVVNCAGVTDMSLLRYEDYEEVNVRLPEMLVDVMKEHGIRRLVHVSTVNTLSFGATAVPLDAGDEGSWPFNASLYARSKRAGEEVLRRGRERYEGLECVVINPGFMLGPYDAKPSSGRMLLAAYRKPVMFAPKGGKAFVHVADVAGAVVGALTKGTAGVRYVAVNSHGHMSIRQLYRLQASVCGYRQWLLAAPDWLLLAAGRAGDLLRRMGVRTEVSTANIRQLLATERYDNTRAREELGMEETPIEKAVLEFYEWKNNRP
ncbi:MAG: NAD-dependent epimerase/dehydratase family protein [Bacteroidales bacterium]|nr:NAD-dependent epimerase/dehydratase family protein [Bacteroidales bacterium]